MMARMTDADDWRLQGQGKYLSGARLRWRAWHPHRPGWDHDHCEFCWAKLADSGEEGTVREGYVTDDDHRWICRACFNDFREQFGWVVE